MRFTANKRAGRGKVVLASAALAISLLTVSGCGYITPQQTTARYAASDGIQADLGPLQLRNMLIVSAGENEPGRVLGAVYNSSSKDITLTISGAEGSETQIPVKAQSSTMLTDMTDPAILSTTGAPAGSVLNARIFENGTNLANDLTLPVLDSTLAEYRKYIPEGAESANPTESAGSSSSPTPSATSTPTTGG
ncbi:hypothetical protein [Pseudarthrobacter sp. PS3-L1]|uniref:hypothetical protein n=1 Tax=Pseudarthrobacter sp. PS3-L1 TaxID=3046207 RepID=UPI0024BA3AA2|nr:hypothetical protein [Pseudarthrobacter sp. PS3-L1]MDJ0322054.1 hypothetical protein [Pseudarthrobacter sp. PS3-L1]